MNTTEDRARAAMRAIAWTVNDAPPLRLPRRHSAAPAPRARRLRWRLWIAPLAAAVAVIGIAVTLVVVRGTPSGRPAPAVTPTPSTAVPPRYYVALNQEQTDFPYSLVVGDTLTGAKVATVPAPPDGTFAGVTGAADDRTFVVESEPGTPGDESASIAPRTWSLLRIEPGSAHPARLTRLPIPVTTLGTDVEAIALSPDGSKLAVAVQPGYPTDAIAAPAYLRVYSVATGALLRSWSTGDGNAAFGGPTYGVPDRNDVLSWRDDGSALSFISSWKVGARNPDGSPVPPGSAESSKIRVHTTLRVLEIAGTGNDLIADSRLTWSMVTAPYVRPGASPVCWSGSTDLLVSPDGKVVVCAATDQFRDPGIRGIGCIGSKPWRDLEFLELSASTGRRLTVLGKYPTNCTGGQTAVYVLWVSQSGDAVIGYMGPSPATVPGQRKLARRFGVFRQGRFTPLPAPLTSGDYTQMNQIAW
jgi:hypothetical protein